MFKNKWLWNLFALATLGSAGFAQAPAEGIAAPANAEPIPGPMPWAVPDEGAPALNLNDSPVRDRLKGNQNFQNFIGFMSDPLQSIDPRAVTELWPMFLSSSISSVPALPSSTMQIYGAGINVALGERLSFGLNQGGYAQAAFSRNQPGLFPNLQGVLQNRLGNSGLREGWLNFGGFAQYTVIENVPDQFLLTAGLRWEAPSGASQLFQGSPPWALAPYLTAGKEIGKFHILATTGYEFDAGSPRISNDFFYLNVHLDRQCFGWLYPLVEFNATYHTTTVNVDLPTKFGFIDTGSYSSSGNLVMFAAGANAVIVRNKLEFGAVYSTLIASQRDFNVNAVLVKMVYRY